MHVESLNVNKPAAEASTSLPDACRPIPITRESAISTCRARPAVVATMSCGRRLPHRLSSASQSHRVPVKRSSPNRLLAESNGATRPSRGRLKLKSISNGLDVSESANPQGRRSFWVTRRDAIPRANVRLAIVQLPLEKVPSSGSGPQVAARKKLWNRNASGRLRNSQNLPTRRYSLACWPFRTRLGRDN